MGPFFEVKKQGDKQTMGSRSTRDKMLTSGGLGRGFEKLQFWGGGGGGGPQKKIFLPPPKKPKKKLGDPFFLNFLKIFKIF